MRSSSRREDVLFLLEPDVAAAALAPPATGAGLDGDFPDGTSLEESVARGRAGGLSCRDIGGSTTKEINLILTKNKIHQSQSCLIY